MPVLFRVEKDVFREAPFVDVMINPVNCMGTMGAGLAAEFAERHPGMLPEFKSLCFDGTMQPGYLHVWKEPDCPYTVINLPTKVDYRDDSDVEYIRKGLMALRRWLKEPGREYLTVTTPMLGCGLGNLEQDYVKPVFDECLGDLPNIINVTQRADQFKTLPKFLVVFGTQGFANPLRPDGKPNPMYEDQLEYMEATLTGWLPVAWGLGLSDFTAVISGGHPGTETAACGAKMFDSTYKSSLMMRLCKGTETKVLTAPVGASENSKEAQFKRLQYLVDLGTHFVGFVPEGVTSPWCDEIVSIIDLVNTAVSEKYPDPKVCRFYKMLDVNTRYGQGDTSIMM